MRKPDDARAERMANGRALAVEAILRSARASDADADACAISGRLEECLRKRAAAVSSRALAVQVGLAA